MVPHPRIVQALLHDLQRRTLLGHEEHGPPVHHGIGDDIRNRLGFSGTWGAVHHERMVEACVYGLDLRTVRREDETGPARIRVGPGFLHLIPGSVQQAADYRILPVIIDIGFQILPYHVLAEREYAQTRTFDDIPGCHPRNRLPCGIHD